MASGERAGWISEAAANNLDTILTCLEITGIAVGVAYAARSVFTSLQKVRAMHEVARVDDPESARAVELEHLINADNATVLIDYLEGLTDNTAAGTAIQVLEDLKERIAARTG